VTTRGFLKKEILSHFKLFIGISLTATVLILLSWFWYSLYGKATVEAIYHGHSTDFLNSLIVGQSTHPVENYHAFLRMKLGHFSKCLMALCLFSFILCWLNVYIGRTAVVCSIVTAFTFLEILFWILMNHPAILANISFMHDPIRYLHLNYGRVAIQYIEGCTHYDSELFYSFNPGSCVFKSVEFSNEFKINSLGLRDDEDSLSQPEVIVLGDSYAMGWGVDQQESFAQRIETMTGKKVLNAGVSSYGTIREMMLLSRLDTSKMKYLVIQYSDGDYEENEEFLENGHRLPIRTENEYHELFSEQRGAVNYYPGKFMIKSIERITLELKSYFPGHEWIEDEIESVMFLNAFMAASDVQLASVKVLLLELNNYCSSDGKFISLLNQRISDSSPEHIKNMEMIHLESVLEPSRHCYTLDDHMNAEGHQAVAEEISKAIIGNFK